MASIFDLDIILNKCYGGLSFSREALERAGFDWEDRYDPGLRRSQRLVDAVRELGDRAAGSRSSKPVVVTIPKEATDWRLMEYDGIETILYVVDGKIHQV